MEKTTYNSEVSRVPQPELIKRLATYGFEQITAECLGIDLSSKPPIVGVRNFINGDPHVGLIPSPKGDAYLEGLVIPTLGENARAISFPPMPGLLKLYEEQGIISKSADEFRALNLIQVEPDVRPVGEDIMGHPYLNPLARLGQKVIDNGSPFVATFPTEEAKAQARQLGFDPIQETEQVRANKVSLHTFAKEYKIPMFDSWVLGENINQLDGVLGEINSKGIKSVWIKVDNTSGGDGVNRYQGEMTLEAITAYLRSVRTKLAKGMKLSEYAEMKSIDEYWPSEMGIPRDGLIFERDAQDQFPGKKVRICSNALEVHKDGKVLVHGDFEQLFEPGDGGAYLGSSPISFDAETTKKLDIINGSIAKMANEKFNFAGVMGVDYIVIEDQTGKVEDIRVIEGNYRDPISFSANTAAAKVAYRHGVEQYSFINSNLTFDILIHNVDQLRAKTTLPDGKSLLDGSIETGMIVPLAPRSLFDSNGNCLYESPVVKCIVMGRNADHCKSLLEQLKQIGIS